MSKKMKILIVVVLIAANVLAHIAIGGLVYNSPDDDLSLDERIEVIQESHPTIWGDSSREEIQSTFADACGGFAVLDQEEVEGFTRLGAKSQWDDPESGVTEEMKAAYPDADAYGDALIDSARVICNV